MVAAAPGGCAADAHPQQVVEPPPPEVADDPTGVGALALVVEVPDDIVLSDVTYTVFHRGQNVREGQLGADEAPVIEDLVECTEYLVELDAVAASRSLW